MNPVSKRRLLTTTTGIILTIALIVSSLSVADNASRYNLYVKYKNEPYTFDVKTSFTNLSEYESTLKDANAIKKVDKIEGVLGFGGVLEYSDTASFVYAGIANSTYKIVGGRDILHRGEILIDKIILSWGIKINDTVKFDIQGSHEIVKKFKVVGVYAGAFYLEGPLILLNYGDFKNLSREANKGTVTMMDSIIYVKANTTYLIESSSVKEIGNKLRLLQRDVENIIISDGGYIEGYGTRYYYSDLSEAGMYYSWFILIFFLPIFMLGFYLTKVGIEIELLERRKELGLIRIRGAPKRKRFRYIALEAVIYSFAGGIAGYLLGLLFSYYTNIAYMKFPYYHLGFDFVTFIGSIILAFLLFFMALHQPLKKIKTSSLVELISHYAQKFKDVDYHYGKDLVYNILLWGYIIGGIYLSTTINYSEGIGIMFILIAIYMVSFIFMFPIVIIFLPLTTSRLLTLGTARVYRFIASGIAKITKISGDLARKSLEREPKRAAYLAFILSFILAFSTMWGVIIDQGNIMQEYQAISEVGGDFLIQTDSITPWERKELQNLLNDTSLVSSYALIAYEKGTSFMQKEVLFTNLTEYAMTIHKIRDFVKEGEIQSGTMIVDEVFVQDTGIRIGDSVIVSTENKNKIYKVSAILYSIPGLGTDTCLADSKMSNQQMWGNPNFNIDHVIICAKNIAGVEKKLQSLFPFHYISLHSQEKTRETMMNEMYSGIMLTFLIIMGAAAIVIVQYSLYLNRRGEIALYKVRGAKTSQIGKLLLTEGGAVIFIALIVGLVIGFILGYMFSYMSTIGLHIPRIFGIGMHFLTGLLSLTLVFFVTQYILGYIFARTNPDYIIRSMGGEL